MLFVHIKTSSKKEIFLYTNVNNNDSHPWKKTCTFLYTQKEKNYETFLSICKKPDIFQKERQFALRFYSQKSRLFTLRDFRETCEIGIYIYTKSMTLCVTRRFYIQKSIHFKNSKSICVTFLYTKILTFCVTQFFILLKLAEGRERKFLYEREGSSSMLFATSY